jgi:hypothetical protein
MSDFETGPPSPLPPGQVLPPLELSGAGSAPVGNAGTLSGRAMLPAELPATPPTAAPTGPAVPTSAANARKKTTTPLNGKSRTGRFETINFFTDHTMRGLPDRAVRAWLVLWRDTKQNGLARTGVADLARRMGCSPSTAKRALADLRRLELVEVVSRGRLSTGPSSYRLFGRPLESSAHGVRCAPA